MWPFAKKKPTTDRAETLRWMARNLCGISYSYGGEAPKDAGIGLVTSALRELADRIDAEAEKPSKGE